MATTNHMKIIWAVTFTFMTAAVVAQDIANHSTGNHTDCAKPPRNKYEEKVCTCKAGCPFVVGCKEGYEGVYVCRPRQEARNECDSRDTCTGHDADTRPTDATSFPVDHIRTTASWNNLTVVSPDGVPTFNNSATLPTPDGSDISATDTTVATPTSKFSAAVIVAILVSVCLVIALTVFIKCRYMKRSARISNGKGNPNIKVRYAVLPGGPIERSATIALDKSLDGVQLLSIEMPE